MYRVESDNGYYIEIEAYMHKTMNEPFVRLKYGFRGLEAGGPHLYPASARRLAELLIKVADEAEELGYSQKEWDAQNAT